MRRKRSATPYDLRTSSPAKDIAEVRGEEVLLSAPLAAERVRPLVPFHDFSVISLQSLAWMRNAD